MRVQQQDFADASHSKSAKSAATTATYGIFSSENPYPEIITTNFHIPDRISADVPDPPAPSRTCRTYKEVPQLVSLLRSWYRIFPCSRHRRSRSTRLQVSENHTPDRTFRLPWFRTLCRSSCLPAAFSESDFAPAARLAAWAVPAAVP